MKRVYERDLDPVDQEVISELDLAVDLHELTHSGPPPPARGSRKPSLDELDDDQGSR